MRFVLLPVAVLAFSCIGCRPAAEAPAGPGEEPLELTDANFQQLVLDSKQPVMVDVYTEQCPPCRTMAPLVAELALEFKGRAIVAKLDANANPAVTAKYRITGVPTFLFFRNGEWFDQTAGARPKQDLAARIEAMLGR